MAVTEVIGLTAGNAIPKEEIYKNLFKYATIYDISSAGYCTEPTSCTYGQVGYNSNVNVDDDIVATASYNGSGVNLFARRLFLIGTASTYIIYKLPITLQPGGRLFISANLYIYGNNTGSINISSDAITWINLISYSPSYSGCFTLSKYTILDTPVRYVKIYLGNALVGYDTWLNYIHGEYTPPEE